MPKVDIEIIDGIEETPEETFEKIRKPERQQNSVGSRYRGELKLSPFIACVVDRAVNQHAEDEFFELSQYQRALGKQNDGYYRDEAGVLKPRLDYDDKHSTMVDARSLHIRHLFAEDVGQIVLRHIANDKGVVRKPKEVARRIGRFANHYTEDSRRYNQKTRDKIFEEKGYTSRAPRRALGDDELQDETLAMLSGHFKTNRELETFGRGNVYALTFDKNSRRFLQAERLRALDMLVGTLGIQHLDNEIEDCITSAKPHMTLIRLGLKLPEWRLFTDGINSAINPFPDTIVTQLDPSARVIFKNDK